MDKYQQQFPNKVKVFVKSNGGLSDARNYGLDRASGEFISFVDSDDYISASMLEEMYHLAKKNDAEMVICNLQKVDEYGNITQQLTQIPNMPEKITLRYIIIQMKIHQVEIIMLIFVKNYLLKKYITVPKLHLAI